MLENLDTIEWQALGRPEIPDLIRGMISPDDEIRIKAIVTFREDVLYLDYSEFEIIKTSVPISELFRSDIQLLTVPFLIEIIENDNFHRKVAIIQLLGDIAGTYVECFEDIEADDYSWEKLHQLRQVVWQGHKVFLSLLEDKQEDNRMAGLRLLAAYPEHADVTIPHLLKFFQRESESNKIEILWNIYTAFGKQVLKESTKNTLHDELMPIIMSKDPFILRITAAVTLIDLLRTTTPQLVVDFVVDALINRKVESPLSQVKSAASCQKQARTLMKLGVSRGLPIALKIIDETKHVKNGFHVLLIAIMLAFSHAEDILEYYGGFFLERSGNERFVVEFTDNVALCDLSSLNTSQKSLIQAIVRNDWIWEYKTNMFEVFGLPETREGLRNLLKDA